MGVSRLLCGSACLLSMMEFKWLQTWRFGVVFFDRFLMLFLPSFLTSFKMPSAGSVLMYRRFLGVQTGLQMEVLFVPETCPHRSLFLSFFHRFGDFSGEAIFKAFGGDPFQVLVRLGSPRHLILRHIFWMFFDLVFEVQNGVQKCMKIGGCKSWSERDRVVSRGAFLDAFISRFQAPKSWNNLELAVASQLIIWVSGWSSCWWDFAL